MDDKRQERVAFIAALGGPVQVAKELGLPKRGHSRVCNWYTKGFPYGQKAALLAMAERRKAEGQQVDVPPEMYEGKREWKWVDFERTPLNAFLYQLTAACGGPENLSVASGIPRMSLRSMRKTANGLMAKHVPAIEKVAVEVGVELPDWWGEARAKHSAYAAEMERRRLLHVDLDYDDEAVP